MYICYICIYVLYMCIYYIYLYTLQQTNGHTFIKWSEKKKKLFTDKPAVEEVQRKSSSALKGTLYT